MMIENILGKIEDFDLSDLMIDRVFFDHESMQKGHQRVASESGRELFISLERGTSLFCGAVLYIDDSFAIVADMHTEDVIEIRPRNNVEWAQSAFNIGNMHSPAYLYADCILTPYEEPLSRMIEALDIPYKRCMRKLDGTRAGMFSHHDHVH